MIRFKVNALSSWHFLHYKSMGKFFIAQGWVTLKWTIQSGPKSNSLQILWLSLLPASLTKIKSKMKSLSIGQHFPQYKSMGAFSCHRNQSFDPICPKTFDQRYSSLKAWTTTDHSHIISSPCEPTARWGKKGGLDELKLLFILSFIHVYIF